MKRLSIKCSFRTMNWATHPVTNGEFVEFIEDGGYERFEFWLSDGWAYLSKMGEARWQMPLYWRKQQGAWFEYTLGGERPLDMKAPLCHVSAYEADAYARWRGCRLPTEQEWEHAAARVPMEGHFLEDAHYHPVATPTASGERPVAHVW